MDDSREAKASEDRCCENLENSCFSRHFVSPVNTPLGLLLGLGQRFSSVNDDQIDIEYRAFIHASASIENLRDALDRPWRFVPIHATAS